ncbi:MAG TPA: hypothetical protein VGG85_17270 [Terracidiphilus sp.]|jgi:hypothetical protein
MNGNEQGSGVRDQGAESLEKLLRAAVPRIDDDAELAHDLWPAMLRRLDERSAAVPWFDWVLMGGLAAVVVAFPAAIPMLLYYL